MRTRRLLRVAYPADSFTNFYEFQTRSDSNGPVELLRIPRSVWQGTTGSPTTKIRKAKPYTCAISNGIMIASQSDDGDNEGEINSFTNSDAIAAIFAASDLELEQLLTVYPVDSAVNGAITSSLRFGDLLLLVSAAEAKKTAVMIRTVFTRFYKFFYGLYNSVKTLSPAEAYRILSDTWLEARYGWRPLFLELSALHELLVNDENFEVRSAYGTDKYDDLDYSFTTDLPITVDGETHVYSHTVTVREITHKAGFNFFNKVASRNDSTLEVLGISTESLLQTAHELIPFSFIVDMFVNIGDFLQTMNWRAEVTPFNGYITTRYLVDVSASIGTYLDGSTSTGATWIIPEDRRSPADAADLAYRYYSALGAHASIEIVDQDMGVAKHYTSFIVPNVEEFDFVHQPLMDADGTIIDDSVHYRYFSSSSDKSTVCYPSLRTYTYTNKSGVVKSVTTRVGVPVPSSILLKEFGEPIDLSAMKQLASSLFNSRLVNGRYINEPRTNGSSLSFDESCILRGIVGVTYNIVRDPSGVEDDYLQLRPDYRVGKLYRGLPFDSDEPRFFHKPVDDVSFSGEYFTRRLYDEFEFRFVSEIDLNVSQATDLAIFGQRLLSHISGK